MNERVQWQHGGGFSVDGSAPMEAAPDATAFARRPCRPGHRDSCMHVHKRIDGRDETCWNSIAFRMGRQRESGVHGVQVGQLRAWMCCIAAMVVNRPVVYPYLSILTCKGVSHEPDS